MPSTKQTPSTALAPLTCTWLALVALTLISLVLGQWFHNTAWLQLLVAVIVWVKGTLVARHFIESHLAHPFIARLLQGFIAFTPIALILTAFYGHQFARWATL